MLSKDKRQIPPNLVMLKMNIRVTTVRFGVPIGTLDVGVTNVAIPLSNNLIALVSNKPQTSEPYILGELRDNCWLKKELSMVHGTLHIFFRNKTFLFVKIES